MQIKRMLLVLLIAITMIVNGVFSTCGICEQGFNTCTAGCDEMSGETEQGCRLSCANFNDFCNQQFGCGDK